MLVTLNWYNNYKKDNDSNKVGMLRSSHCKVCKSYPEGCKMSQFISLTIYEVIKRDRVLFENNGKN